MAFEETSPTRKWLVKSRAWIGILILVPFAIGESILPPLVREETVGDFLLDLIAWVTFIAGATFRWWATLYVGGRKNTTVICDGPYSICRNPLYVGTFLIVLSIALFLHSALLAFGLIIASVFYLGVTVPVEESKLRERFGDEYARYVERVPRFVPALRRVQSPSVINVRLSGLVKEYGRTWRWIWVPFLTEIIAHLRMVKWR
jgi:protein-S-isoprenylcysteine O-methyltransferase Ste14